MDAEPAYMLLHDAVQGVFPRVDDRRLTSGMLFFPLSREKPRLWFPGRPSHWHLKPQASGVIKLLAQQKGIDPINMVFPV
jgi:hypothetical protein